MGLSITSVCVSMGVIFVSVVCVKRGHERGEKLFNRTYEYDGHNNLVTDLNIRCFFSAKFVYFIIYLDSRRMCHSLQAQ